MNSIKKETRPNQRLECDSVSPTGTQITNKRGKQQDDKNTNLSNQIHIRRQ